ncbi:actin-like ATPase domain-containing protein [Ramaria rubella]|nr:actin-like ATPase domain-containing protein [Ramaria rubella]
MSAFRESSVIVIESSQRTIRVGVGLGDFLHTPSIEFPARVGLRKDASTSKLPTSGGDQNVLNGQATNFQNGDTLKQRAAVEEDAVMNGHEAGNRPTRTYIRPTRRRTVVPDAKVSEYLVGTQLDEAIAAGDNVEIYWPLEEGNDIQCWSQVEALWKYVLFTRLQLRRKQNESPVALCVPSSYPRATHELLAQLFFERFNVAGFMLVERPLMQLFAVNSLYGVVVDISYSYTTITPITDSIIQHSHEVHIAVGTRDCELYLVNLLRSNSSLVGTLTEGESYTEEQLTAQLLELAQQIWRDSLVKVPSDGETAQGEEDEGVTNIAALLVAGKEKAAIEAGTKKKATAKQTQAEREREREIAALDLVQVEFKGKTLTLGRERHRFCEPLFDPTLLQPLSTTPKDSLTDNTVPLQEAVHMAVNSLPVDRRWLVWSSVFISGDITNGVKGLAPALQSRLYPFLLTDHQGNKHVNFLKLPEYFGDYLDKGDGLAAFLGTCIVAKLAFNDPASKNYLSKADYASQGPRAILDFSPAVY